VSDDLEMRAIADRWPAGEAAWRAVAAGCDQLLVCKELARAREAIDGLDRALDRGVLDEERVRDAGQRWDDLTERYAKPAPGTEGLAWLDSAGHRARIDEVLAGLV